MKGTFQLTAYCFGLC